MLLVVVCTAVVSAAAGIGATFLIKSPQQQAAEAAGPAPTTMTAAVEKRVLQQTSVLRGKVVGGRTVEVTPGTTEGRQAVVTAVRVKAGSEVPSGSVVLEVAGRPLIALPGAAPAYRDLRPGMRGEDVRQLQAALKELGRDPGESNGTFGNGTKKALAGLYESLGFEPATTGAEDGRALTAARAQVVAADRAVTDARDARAQAATPDQVKVADRALTRANEDARTARQNLAELESTTGTMLPLAEVVFLPAFPARVEKTSAQVGGEVKAPLVTLSSGALVVRSILNPAQRELLKPGLAVELFSEVAGVRVTGKVASVGELERDEKAGTAGYPMVVEPDTPLDGRLGGEDVRVTVETARTEGEVLVVPNSAMYAGADGKIGVLKIGAEGREERVEVTVGTSGGGFVSVTPVSGELEPGDKVVVGRDDGR